MLNNITPISWKTNAGRSNWNCNGWAWINWTSWGSNSDLVRDKENDLTVGENIAGQTRVQIDWNGWFNIEHELWGMEIPAISLKTNSINTSVNHIFTLGYYRVEDRIFSITIVIRRSTKLEIWEQSCITELLFS